MLQTAEQVRALGLDVAWVVAQQDVKLLPAKCPVYRQPCGKVSILQDKFAALCKMAVKASAYDKSWLPSRHAVIRVDMENHDQQLFIEVMGADGPVTVGYIGAKVERSFRCAVDVKLLGELIPLLAPERIDLTYDPNEGRLIVECGANKSRLIAVPEKELWAVPEQTALELTAEQKSAVAWLKKAVGTPQTSAPPVLRYVHVRDGVAIASDGYRLHIVKGDAVNGLPEWVDVNKLGKNETYTYPNVSPFLNMKGEGISVHSSSWSEKRHDVKTGKQKTVKYSNSLLQCVKTVGKTDKTVITFTTDEQTSELVVSGLTGDDKSAERRIKYSGHGFIHSGRYNAKFLIDALSGMSGDTVSICQTEQGEGRILTIGDGERLAVVMGLIKNA